MRRTRVLARGNNEAAALVVNTLRTCTVGKSIAASEEGEGGMSRRTVTELRRKLLQAARQGKSPEVLLPKAQALNKAVSVAPDILNEGGAEKIAGLVTALSE